MHQVFSPYRESRDRCQFCGVVIKNESPHKNAVKKIKELLTPIFKRLCPVCRREMPHEVRVLKDWGANKKIEKLDTNKIDLNFARAMVPL